MPCRGPVVAGSTWVKDSYCYQARGSVILWQGTVPETFNLRPPLRAKSGLTDGLLVAGSVSGHDRGLMLDGLDAV